MESTLEKTSTGGSSQATIETQEAVNGQIGELTPSETWSSSADHEVQEESSRTSQRPAKQVRTSADGGKSTGQLVIMIESMSDRRAIIRDTLESAGYRVLEAIDSRQAATIFDPSASVVILGNTNDPDRWELLARIRNASPTTQILAMIEPSRRREGVLAMRQGAAGYMVLPLSPEELNVQVSHAAYLAAVEQDNSTMSEMIGFPSPPLEMVGESCEMQMVRKQIKSFGCLDSTALITGSRGTGKTIVAQLIHHSSARTSRPLVVVPCDSIPRDMLEDELFGHVRGALEYSPNARAGRVELAHQGTLLIDEIGLLPLELQPKLLQLFQQRSTTRIGSNRSRQVDVRVIATSSLDLASLTRQGDFNEELYHRLNVLSLHLADLKDHPEDIPLIGSVILSRMARRQRTATAVLTDDALTALRRYHWPGNIRELEDVLQRAAVHCGGVTIRAKDLDLDPSRSLMRGPTTIDGRGLAGMTLAEIERAAILETIRSTGGNKAKAARRLEVSEKTIYNKIKQYNLTSLL